MPRLLVSPFPFRPSHRSQSRGRPRLTQGFFEHLIEKSFLAAADPARGKFRSFLLATFKHFLAHEREKTLAQKRGGGLEWISLDQEEAIFHEPAYHRTPDLHFDHGWAIALFDQVLGRLREEFRLSGQEALFESFKQFLAGDPPDTYGTVAARIGMTEGAAKMFVSRLRARYRNLLRAEIARTVSNPAEIDEELHYLRQVFLEEA